VYLYIYKIIIHTTHTYYVNKNFYFGFDYSRLIASQP